MAPTVSVIMPAYNSSATIAAALASVFQQTYGDMEVIVVDDASPDDSARVAEATLRGSRWAAVGDTNTDRNGLLHNSRGRHGGRPSIVENRPFSLSSGGSGSVPTVLAGVLQEARKMESGPQGQYRILRLPQNRGPAAARNAGLTVAGGDWIAFLDADDAWVPDRLRLQMAALQDHPQAVMLCGYTAGFGEPVPRPAPQPDELFELDAFAIDNPVATSTVLVRRQVVLDAGGFDERFRGPEDYDLWMRVAARGSVVKLGAVLAFYRHVSGSLSMDDRKFLPQVLAVLDKAYGPDGVLRAFPPLRRVAVATQLWNASWMAFHRGARGPAIRFLVRAFFVNATSSRPVQRKWLPLLWRYVAGRR